MRAAAPQQKEKIVVLGAGPAGMSAAWRLSELGYPVTVLEKDTAVGGMGKTITVGKYTAPANTTPGATTPSTTTPGGTG